MYIYQYNILEVFDMKNRILKSIAAALALCTAMLDFTACSGWRYVGHSGRHRGSDG